MADVCNNRPVNGKEDGGLQEDTRDTEEAKKELDTWKTKAEKADDVKDRMILEKLEEDETKSKAQQELVARAQKQEECQKESTKRINSVQAEILRLAGRKQNLLDKLKGYQVVLQAKRAESTKLKCKFKIYTQVPDTAIEFKAQIKEERDENSEPIKEVFTIIQRPTVSLQGGEALITFEEEKVASQILKNSKCSVSCGNISLDVKPKRITMDPTVKFEVHLEVSRRELKVSGIVDGMPEERMKERLKMSFSRPSRGGGEVDHVQYDMNTGAGVITFLHPGVAESLALRGKYRVDLDSEVTMQVGPIYKYELSKFQNFCGSPRRTILLEDIEDKGDEEDLLDHLEIYFQKPSNHGGEIKRIEYTPRGKALQVFFSEDSAAAAAT
ncbi:N-myc-interactor isoform 2-T3 [Spinachia spinachia]